VVVVIHNAVSLGKQGVITPAADVVSGVDPGAALSDQNGSGRHSLTIKYLGAEALGGRVAAIPSGTASLGLRHQPSFFWVFFDEEDLEVEAFFFVAAVLAAGFFAAVFLAAVFVVVFFAAGFFAAAVLAAGFFAAVFLAAVFVVVFFAAGLFAAVSFAAAFAVAGFLAGGFSAAGLAADFAAAVFAAAGSAAAGSAAAASAASVTAALAGGLAATPGLLMAATSILV
jgi:hypothetical protein